MSLNKTGRFIQSLLKIYHNFPEKKCWIVTFGYTRFSGFYHFFNRTSNNKVKLSNRLIRRFLLRRLILSTTEKSQSPAHKNSGKTVSDATLRP